MFPGNFSIIYLTLKSIYGGENEEGNNMPELRLSWHRQKNDKRVPGNRNYPLDDVYSTGINLLYMERDIEISRVPKMWRR